MKLSEERHYFIERTILKKLAQHNIWGAKHTNYEFVHKGLPKELRGFAKDVADELIRDGLLLSHPTGYGMQISMNPDKAKEIKAIIGIQN